MKQEMISIRTTAEEKDSIEKRAKDMGFTTSGFLIYLFYRFRDNIPNLSKKEKK